ncbi:MAG: electron transfer flavoprotein subunit beta/FixA family protein [Candidatus Thorarchaeota archaeon]
MNILVLIKQVPLPKEMKTTQEGFMARTGVRSIMNPYCKHALEEALRFREQTGGKCTVLAMGPPSFEQSLKEALSMGADDAYLLTDRRLAGSDTMATAQALSRAIKSIEQKFDIVFAGIQTIDGDTGHVGPQVAERIGYPQITYADQVIDKGGTIQVRRITEHGFEIVESGYPILVTVTKYANVPRGPRLKHAIRARNYDIKTLNIDDIGLSEEDAGITGSPTIVSKVRNVDFDRPPCHLLDGNTAEEKVDRLIEFLKLNPHREVA